MRFNNNIYHKISASGSSCIYDLRNEIANIYFLNFNETRRLTQVICGADDYLDEKMIELVNNKILVESVKDLDPVIEYDLPRTKYAVIKITNSCTYNCPNCHNKNTYSMKEYNDYIPIDDFKLLCDQISLVGIKSIIIVGGEPSLHPYFVDLIQYGLNKFDSLEIYTNAYLINSELLELYKKEKVLVSISVFSDKIADSSEITGLLDSFSKVKNTINLFKEESINYRIHYGYLKNIKSELARTGNFPYFIDLSYIELSDEKQLKEKFITKEKFNKSIKSADIFGKLFSDFNTYPLKIYVDLDMNVYSHSNENMYEDFYRYLGNIKQSDLLSFLTYVDEISEKEYLDSIRGFDCCKYSEDFIPCLQLVKGCNMCEYSFACLESHYVKIPGEHYMKPWYCLYDEKNGVWIDR